MASINVLKFERGEVFEFILVSKHVQILISVSHFDEELVIISFRCKSDVNFVHILLIILKRSITCPHFLINIRIFINTMVLHNSWLVAQIFNRLNLCRRWI